MNEGLNIEKEKKEGKEPKNCINFEEMEKIWIENFRKFILECKTLCVEPNRGFMTSQAKKVIEGTNLNLITETQMNPQTSVEEWIKNNLKEKDFPVAVYGQDLIYNETTKENEYPNFVRIYPSVKKDNEDFHFNKEKLV